MRKSRAMVLWALLAGSALFLSGCGGGGDNGDGGAGEGFEYGASQEEIDQAIAELDPVTITFQPSAASEASVQSPSGTEIAAAIEEKSGGQITVDVVWGQAIAGYDQVHDALVDGRVDIAYTLPVYQPDEFPAVNAIGDMLGGLSPSPFVGEMVTNAVAADVGWNTPEVVEDYTSQGLTPLVPVVASGGYYSVCNETGMAADDWQGRQVRIASASQNQLMLHIGASPVSMEYTETYEALQRGTVDCTLAQLVPSAEAGIFEVAPNVGYMTDTSYTRAPGAMVAGSNFEQLPLAYQQLIFDTYADYYQGQMMTTIGGNADGIRQAKEAGGEIEGFPDDLQETIEEFNKATKEEIVDSGVVGEETITRLEESAEKWTQRAEELGYTDEGNAEDFDEWYDTETDYRPLATEVYEDAFLEFRPN